MEQYDEEDYNCSLLLLFSAERMMVKRKVYEALHDGLSLGLLDNPIVLMEIQKFLSGKLIKERLEKLLKS